MLTISPTFIQLGVYYNGPTRYCRRLRRYAISWRVAASSPDNVIQFPQFN
jgi:hypothetical protein